MLFYPFARQVDGNVAAIAMHDDGTQEFARRKVTCVEKYLQRASMPRDNGFVDKLRPRAGTEVFDFLDDEVLTAVVNHGKLLLHDAALQRYRTNLPFCRFYHQVRRAFLGFYDTMFVLTACQRQRQQTEKTEDNSLFHYSVVLKKGLSQAETAPSMYHYAIVTLQS